jgi:outer membrane protein assembly factor BamB
MRSLVSALVLTTILGYVLPLRAGDWPQFRGPNSGLAVGDRKLPVQIGPEQNILWQTALPPGHSSPVLYGDRIYLTGVRGKALVVIALDQKSGALLWETQVPHKELEKIHSIGSYAQSTPVTDGNSVISFFGSSGLICHDRTGKLLWHLPMGPFKNDFGAASSPILVGGVVILNQDHDSDSFLMAVAKRTGKVLWRTDRSEFPVGYASPVIWEVEGRKQIVVAGTLRVVGYDFETGKELWTVAGMARVMNMTPTVGPDGTLYVAGWAAGADADDRFPVPGFDEMLAQYDADKNGTLELDELPTGPIKQRFSLIDRDKDGHITKVEYEGMRQIFLTAQNRLIAIKPGGHGDLTKSNVLWTLTKHLPFVPSPLLYKQHLFLVKNGGIVSSVDSRTGRPIKQERVRGGGDYYSSPVGGDGKVYLFSQRGHANVISAEGQWQVLASSKFDEEIYATPAIVDGRIYVRTTGRLHCFGLRP